MRQVHRVKTPHPVHEMWKVARTDNRGWDYHRTPEDHLGACIRKPGVIGKYVTWKIRTAFGVETDYIYPKLEQAEAALYNAWREEIDSYPIDVNRSVYFESLDNDGYRRQAVIAATSLNVLCRKWDESGELVEEDWAIEPQPEAPLPSRELEQLALRYVGGDRPRVWGDGGNGVEPSHAASLRATLVKLRDQINDATTEAGAWDEEAFLKRLLPAWEELNEAAGKAVGLD